MTREEFLAWAIPRYARWLKTRPNDTPSLDRKDSTKHYSLDNIRLLEWGENAQLASRNVNVHAPDGLAWCSEHRRYFPKTEFHKSAGTHNGVSNRCKLCVKNYQAGYYANKRQAGKSDK